MSNLPALILTCELLYFVSTHTRDGEIENGLVSSCQPVKFGPPKTFMRRSNCIWQAMYGSQNSWCVNTLQTLPFFFFFYLCVLTLQIHSVILNVSMSMIWTYAHIHITMGIHAVGQGSPVHKSPIVAVILLLIS